MPQFRVVKKAFLRPAGEANLRIVRVNEVIRYDGAQSRGLQPLDAEAEAACARAGGGWNRGSLAASFAQHNRR